MKVEPVFLNIDESFLNHDHLMLCPGSAWASTRNISQGAETWIAPWILFQMGFFPLTRFPFFPTSCSDLKPTSSCIHGAYVQTYRHLETRIRADCRCPQTSVWIGKSLLVCDSDHLCPLNDWQHQHTFHRIQLCSTCGIGPPCPVSRLRVLHLCLTVSVLKLLPAFLPRPINTGLAWLILDPLGLITERVVK